MATANVMDTNIGRWTGKTCAGTGTTGWWLTFPCFLCFLEGGGILLILTFSENKQKNESSINLNTFVEFWNTHARVWTGIYRMGGCFRLRFLKFIPQWERSDEETVQVYFPGFKSERVQIQDRSRAGDRWKKNHLSRSLSDSVWSRKRNSEDLKFGSESN